LFNGFHFTEILIEVHMVDRPNVKRRQRE
jgi:hypothetical protein